MTVLLVVVGVAFAFSMGAHYSGATMGMPVGLRAIRPGRALAVLAVLALVSAAFASHAVEHTVSLGLIGPDLGVRAEVIVIGVAFALTSVYNVVRIPTSTIQILVFTLVGVALALSAPIAWSAIGALAAVWVTAPFLACGLGFVLTKAADQVPAIRNEVAAEASGGPITERRVMRASGALAAGLVLVGTAASFTMGANDVSNATGSFIAAQLVQAGVILAAVSLGYFTSMNQALVGAMTGAGIARGRTTVKVKTVKGIVGGWGWDRPPGSPSASSSPKRSPCWSEQEP